MTADEFIAWARGQPRRHELVAGEAIAMSPERLDHIRIKSSAWLRLREAVLASGLACEAVADGCGLGVAITGAGLAVGVTAISARSSASFCPVSR